MKNTQSVPVSFDLLKRFDYTWARLKNGVIMKAKVMMERLYRNTTRNIKKTLLAGRT